VKSKAKVALREELSSGVELISKTVRAECPAVANGFLVPESAFVANRHLVGES